MLALAEWKREGHVKEWTPEQLWGPSLIYATQIWGATRAVFNFPLCNLLIPQHLKIPQISINLKSGPLPSAQKLLLSRTGERFFRQGINSGAVRVQAEAWRCGRAAQ